MTSTSCCAAVIQADPFVVFKNPLETPREIDFVTLRVKLLTPDLETLQLFWIGALWWTARAAAGPT